MCQVCGYREDQPAITNRLASPAEQQEAAHKRQSADCPNANHYGLVRGTVVGMVYKCVEKHVFESQRGEQYGDPGYHIKNSHSREVYMQVGASIPLKCCSSESEAFTPRSNDDCCYVTPLPSC
jgi:hypothetical protein